MKIRTKLTLLFTFITAVILLIFAVIIYYSAKNDRENEFYEVLRKEAITKSNLFLNAEVDTKTLQDIYHRNRVLLNEVEVAIYDRQFRLLYHDAVEIDFVKETDEMKEEIVQNGEIQFYQENWQVIGILYSFKGENYIVTAAALDQYGFNKLDSLLQNIIVVFIVSILFIYAVGFYFSRKALAPMKQMTERAKQISASHLDLRLNINKSNDELTELAETFNEMLNRLEKSFDAQKHFVSTISHELRTPLSAIITELELSIDKERKVEDYRVAIQNTLKDTRRLVQLSNSLLDLAKANYDRSEISFKTLRIDEILLDARQQVQRTTDDYKIDIYFEDDIEDETHISVNGNEYLLRLAFSNLFDNGCKFSEDKKCIVALSCDSSNVKLQFSDNGIGISEANLKHIYEPFYRGRNKDYAEGNGIGLSLTQKIILLHKGEIMVSSKESSGTTFTILLPHL